MWEANGRWIFKRIVEAHLSSKIFQKTNWDRRFSKKHMAPPTNLARQTTSKSMLQSFGSFSSHQITPKAHPLHPLRPNGVSGHWIIKMHEKLKISIFSQKIERWFAIVPKRYANLGGATRFSAPKRPRYWHFQCCFTEPVPKIFEFLHSPAGCYSL